MKPNLPIRTGHQDTFDFLLFRLGSFLLGVSAEQVVQIKRSNMPQMDTKTPFVNLRDIFHMTSRTRTDDATTLLEVKNRSGRTHFPVDAAEDTISLTLDQIRKLPPLIDLHKSHPALWGVAILKDQMAFLVDLNRMDAV